MKKKRRKRWLNNRIRMQQTLDRRRRFNAAWDKHFENVGLIAKK